MPLDYIPNMLPIVSFKHMEAVTPQAIYQRAVGPVLVSCNQNRRKTVHFEDLSHNTRCATSYARGV